MTETIDRESEVSIDSQGKITKRHIERMRVESESPLTTAQILERLALIPGMPYTVDPFTGLQSVKVKQIMHRNPWRYEVTLTYANNIPDAEQSEKENPFEEEPEVSWEDGEMEIAIDKDRDGAAILLPTGRPFSPGVKMFIPTGRLVITRNERTLDFDPGLNYRMRVNANTYAGREAETLLLRSARSSRKVRNGVVYYPTTYVFEWNPRGWNEEVLLADTYELVDDEAVPILDDKKNPITEPVPITETGVRVPQANLPDDAEYLKVKKYKLANFETLRFPV